MTGADAQRLSPRRLLELGGLAGAAALVGCSDDDTTPDAAPTTTSPLTASLPTTTTEARPVPEFVRTPEERFEGLVGFDYEPHYVHTAEGIRLHYLDEGPGDAGVALLLHGEATWSAALAMVDHAPPAWASTRWFYGATETGKMMLAARKGMEEKGAPQPMWFFLTPGDQ